MDIFGCISDTLREVFFCWKIHIWKIHTLATNSVTFDPIHQ